MVAIPILKSPSCTLSTSTINSVPSTYKSPLILTRPEVVPAPAGEGSIQISDGPSIYAVLPAPFAIDIPIPVVINLLLTFNDAVVIIPDTFTSSNSLCPLTSNPVNVPTDVTFVCAAVCNVPLRVVAVTLAMPVIFVELSPAILPLAVISPETVRAVRVPSDVILV